MNAHHAVDIRISQDTYNYRIRVDNHGTLWIGTASGLFTATCVPRSPCTPRAALPGPTAIKVNDFILGADQAGSGDHVQGIWMVGNHGLDHLVNGNLTHVEVPDVPNRFDLIAAAPDGSLWLAGIVPGLIRVRIVGGKAAIAESHTRPALTSDYIEFMDTDHLGRLWAGTDHGINIVSQGTIYSITDEDGLIWNDTDGKSFFEDSDGSVWIGTGKGLSHLLDPTTVISRQPFDARIEPLRYDDATISGQSTRWNGGTATLRFSGATFRGDRSLVYHYRLEGFDSREIATKTPLVRFQKLPPGLYTLHVVVEDPARHFFSSPASYQFTLIAPWGRTQSFYFLLGMVGLGLLVLGWRRSHRALLSQRQKLQRLVNERTQELQELATHDGLTHMLNRTAILSALATECAEARKRDAGVCIALIDLDHFKEVNDTFGHLAGDEVLRQTATRLARNVRSTDALGRYGGEEFLIIFRDASGECGLERCEDIRQSLLSEPIVFQQHKLNITCSIGLAWSQAEDDAITNLLTQADRAMYDAKAKGRNRVESGLTVHH
jgi:diguanylate cyclase (GGDEF)-like protein